MADRAAPGYRTRVKIEGHLTKKGAKLGRKARRYFKLNGTDFCNFKNEATPSPTWIVNVHKCAVVEHPESNMFEIRLDPAVVVSSGITKNSLKLWAEKKADFDMWIKGLKETSLNSVVDFYELGALIGKGSYGEVRNATDRDSKIVRAVKVMERTGDAAEHEFIRREVEVMRQIEHPSIVKTYDIFDEERNLYIVMDLVAGGDLFEVIAENEDFSEKSAADILKQVLEGLAYLHDKEIVHRDIKPENILCVSNEPPYEVKLTDFGFANVNNPDNQMQTLIGTPFYMAPEILKRQGHSYPVDIFACGVVLYAMLSGTLPFESEEDDGEKNVFELITEGEVIFPIEDFKGVTEEAKALVLKMLAKLPENRPTAHQALADPWFEKVKQKGGMKRLESDLSRLKKFSSQKSKNTNISLDDLTAPEKEPRKNERPKREHSDGSDSTVHSGWEETGES